VGVCLIRVNSRTAVAVAASLRVGTDRFGEATPHPVDNSLLEGRTPSLGTGPFWGALGTHNNENGG
jgi:hypothetical protein